MTQDGSNQGGAPLLNRNALRHGLRAGRLPPGCGAIRKSCDELRRQLEDAVVAKRGTMQIIDAARIQSIVRHERHCMLVQRWLRVAWDELSHSERLNYAREITRATDLRDATLSKLDIDVTDDDPWDFTRDQPRIGSDVAQQPPSCDEAASGDREGVRDAQNATQGESDSGGAE